MHQIGKLILRELTSRPLLWLLPAATAFVYLEVFILIHTPLLAQDDQSIYFYNATRILRGQMIYRDFFQFTPPGTELLYAALFKLFGIHAWIPSVMLIFVGVSLTWLSVFVSAKVLKGWSVLLPALLFLTIAFRSALDATHHWYSSLAVITALAVTVGRRNRRRLAAAGALCGLATCFTQLQGLAGALAIGLFLLWERRRETQTVASLVKAEAWLFAPFASTIAALNAYFVWKVGPERFWFCTIVFGVKFYRSEWFNTWRVYMADLPPPHSGLDLPRWGGFLFIHIVLPLVYLLFFARYWRVSSTRPAEPWDRLMLVNIVGLFLFVGVAAAPSYFRLCSVCLPALIILVWFVSQEGRLERTVRRLLWAGALALAVAGPASRQHHWRGYLDLPTGRTAFLDPVTYDEYRWISGRTRPSEPFFGGPVMCLALGLRNPAEVNFVTSTDYTRPEQVANVVEVLERDHVHYVVLWDFTLDAPDTGQTNSSHLGPLSAYLGSHYRVVKTFAGGSLVWERKK
jgi:hypothetical protein